MSESIKGYVRSSSIPTWMCEYTTTYTRGFPGLYSSGPFGYYDADKEQLQGIYNLLLSLPFDAEVTIPSQSAAGGGKDVTFKLGFSREEKLQLHVERRSGNATLRNKK